MTPQPEATQLEAQPAVPSDDGVAEASVEEVLVEEVSIDGLCGVY